MVDIKPILETLCYLVGAIWKLTLIYEIMNIIGIPKIRKQESKLHFEYYEGIT